MSSHTTLQELFVHNDWARDKLMTLASGLSDDNLDRPFEMGMGSLRATLHHLWAAERIWLDRWLEGAAQAPEPAAGIALSALWDRFRSTALEREEFLDRAGESGESRRITYTRKSETYTHPLGDMMLHVTNHGIHHRAQALNMLKRCGVKVPGLDYLAMKIEYPSLSFPAEAVEQFRQRMPIMIEIRPSARYDRDTVREYYRYGDWAFDQAVTSAMSLSDDALDRVFEIGLGTLRQTLLHIRNAEEWWLQNWTTGPSDFPRLPPETSLSDLQSKFRETSTARNTFLDSLTNEDLQKPVEIRLGQFTGIKFCLGESMLQLCGHGTHHRAQALNMLRQLSARVPPVDYMAWFREQSK